MSRPPYASLNLSEHVGDDAAAVRENRRRVAAQLGVETVWLTAEHGNQVRVLDAGRLPDAPPVCDALVTREVGLAVGALAADCALIVLADVEFGVVGVAHCGRPGLVAGIAGVAVEAMRQLGARRIGALVGPTVCAECYEVPDALAALVTASVPEAAARSASGSAALDIRAGVCAQLGRAGVEQVRNVGGCTRHDPRWFSYRRDGVTGRAGALGWLVA